MNLSTTLFLFLLVVHSIALDKSDELQDFEKEVEKARRELEDLKNSINAQGEQLRKQRRSVEELLDSFEDADEDVEIDEMDKWLHSLSAPQIKNRFRSDLTPVNQHLYDEESDVGLDIVDPLKEWYSDDVGMPNNDDDSSKIDRYSVDNLRSQDYDEFDDMIDKNMYDDNAELSKCDKTCGNSPSNDEYNMNKNDFSHEANYKLSKLEQEASEKRKTHAYPNWNWNPNVDLTQKRSLEFNPMDEIKLKTSTRMMAHGFGASLPSNSLTDLRRENLVDDMLRNIERKWDDGIKLIEVNKKDDNNNNNINNNNMNKNYGLDNFNMYSVNPRILNFRRKRLNSENKMEYANPSALKSMDNQMNENEISQPSLNTNNDNSIDDNRNDKNINNDDMKEQLSQVNKLPTELKNNENDLSQLDLNKNNNNGFEEQLTQYNKLQSDSKNFENDLTQSNLNNNNNNNNNKEDVELSKFQEAYNSNNNDFIPIDKSAMETRGTKNNLRSPKSIGAQLTNEKVLDIHSYPIENTHNLPLIDIERSGAEKLNEGDQFTLEEGAFKKAIAQLKFDELLNEKHETVKGKITDDLESDPAIFNNGQKMLAINAFVPQEANVGEVDKNELENPIVNIKKKRESWIADNDDEAYDEDLANNELSKYYEYSDIDQLDQNDEHEYNSDPAHAEYDDYEYQAIDSPKHLTNSISKLNSDSLQVLKAEANRLAANIERTNRDINIANEDMKYYNRATNQLRRSKRDLYAQKEDLENNKNDLKNNENNIDGMMSLRDDEHKVVELNEKHDEEMSGKEQRNIHLFIPMRNIYGSQYMDQNEKEVNFNNLWFGENTNNQKTNKEKPDEFGIDDMFTNNSYFFIPNANNLNFKSILQNPNSDNTNSQEKTYPNEEKYESQANPSIQDQEQHLFPHYQNPGCMENKEHSQEECKSSFEPPTQKPAPCKSSDHCKDEDDKRAGYKNSILNNNLRRLEQKVENVNKKYESNKCNMPNKGCKPEIIRTESSDDYDDEENTSVQEKLLAAVKNQVKNCDSLENLEEVLNNLPHTVREESSNSHDVENRLQSGIDKSSCMVCKLPQKHKCKKKKSKNDLMKLNITIKANVCGNQQNRQYSGDASIKVQPGILDDRGRRAAHVTQGDQKNRESRSGDCEEPISDNPLSNLLNGKLSSQVVQSVFNLVQGSPKYNVLWPALKQNRVMRDQRFKNFYAVRNCRNEPVVRRAEGLVVSAMKSLNDIVEQQARQRACIPLRPDLAGFYELILTTYEDMDAERKRRDTTSNSVEDISEELKIIDANSIEERSCSVKKLLQQYEDLPREEQHQVAGLRDDLLKDLMYLRKLREHYNEIERDKRERLLREHEEAQQLIDDAQAKEMKVSPEYLKLVKTAELLRESESDD